MIDPYWYIACRSRALGRKPHAVRIHGERLVLFRGQDGTPGAVEDRCLHRNAPLSAGHVCRGELVCPYHGWAYDTDGALARIPAEGDAQGSRPCAADGSRPRLAAWRCVEQEGFIWVCAAEHPTTAAPPAFAHFGATGWTSFVMVTDFPAPVDACLENFLDVPHAAYVHRGWFRSPRRQKIAARVRPLPDGAAAIFENEPRGGSLVFRLFSSARAGLTHTDRYIAPATSRVDYDFTDGRHFVITSSCTPVERDLTRVYTVITFKSRLPGQLVRLLFEPLCRFVIRQDVVILRRTQANIDAFGGRRFVNAATDLLAPFITEWRRAVREGTAPPPMGEERLVDVQF